MLNCGVLKRAESMDNGVMELKSDVLNLIFLTRMTFYFSDSTINLNLLFCWTN